MNRSTLFILFSLLLISACSSEKKHTTIIKGSITVADSLDDSKDYSGIGFLVFQRDSTQKADTLLYVETDKNGQFTAEIEVPAKGIYPVYVSRYKNIVASSSLILNEDDTLKITAQLPAYNQTEKIESREYMAQEVLGRINRNFSRLASYVNSGRVKQDTLPAILANWSTLFWSVHTKYPNTLAADRAIEESFRLIAGINDSLILSKYDSLKAFTAQRVAFARVAGEAKARTAGLESALQFLRDVESEIEKPAQKLQIIRNQIEFLADSNQHERAYDLLKTHDKMFNTVKGAQSWAKYFAKETKRLAPGNPLPQFALATATDSLFNKSYAEKFFVLEVAGLSDVTYREQLVEMNAVFQLFKTYGLEWLTVPLDNQIAIDAFLTEQNPSWTFVNANNYLDYRLMDSLNVIQVPTRFLVNRQGNIVRKYGPNELNRLFNDILYQFQNDKKEPNS